MTGRLKGAFHGYSSNGNELLIVKYTLYLKRRPGRL